ncbi:MAG: hypothetical protein J5509_06975 [Lachnospiraceae bacterium]|nr:hypothetical protein [Lachnospiraceae bacterium]
MKTDMDYYEIEIQGQTIYLPKSYTVDFLFMNNPTTHNCLNGYAFFHRLSGAEAEKEILQKISENRYSEIATEIVTGMAQTYGSDLFIYTNIVSYDELDLDITIPEEVYKKGK